MSILMQNDICIFNRSDTWYIGTSCLISSYSHMLGEPILGSAASLWWTRASTEWMHHNFLVRRQSSVRTNNNQAFLANRLSRCCVQLETRQIHANPWDAVRCCWMVAVVMTHASDIFAMFVGWWMVVWLKENASSANRDLSKDRALSTCFG